MQQGSHLWAFLTLVPQVGYAQTELNSEKGWENEGSQKDSKRIKGEILSFVLFLSFSYLFAIRFLAFCDPFLFLSFHGFQLSLLEKADFEKTIF